MIASRDFTRQVWSLVEKHWLEARVRPPIDSSKPWRARYDPLSNRIKSQANSSSSSNTRLRARYRIQLQRVLKRPCSRLAGILTRLKRHQITQQSKGSTMANSSRTRQIWRRDWRLTWSMSNTTTWPRRNQATSNKKPLPVHSSSKSNQTANWQLRLLMALNWVPRLAVSWKWRRQRRRIPRQVTTMQSTAIEVEHSNRVAAALIITSKPL